MNKEMTALQSQVARISAELADAQRTIRTLEARKAGRPRRAALWLGIVITTVALASWGGSAQPPTTQDAQIADLIKRVTALEKLRVMFTTLEQSEKKLEQSKNRVTAPFEVVDNAGKPIFRVTTIGDRGAYVFNNAGQEVVDLTSPDGVGGSVGAYGAEIGTYMTMSALKSQAGFELAKIGKLHAELKTTEKGGLLYVNAADGGGAIIGAVEDGRGRIGLRVTNKQGNTVAAVALNKDSPTGVISIAGQDGRPAAGMAVVGNQVAVVALHDGKTVAALGAEEDGRGYFTAFFNGKPAAMLTSSSENLGAGRLTLNAPDGGWAVRAGYSGTHGDVAVGGYGAEGKAASHSLWGSAVVGSLAK